MTKKYRIISPDKAPIPDDLEIKKRMDFEKLIRSRDHLKIRSNGNRFAKLTVWGAAFVSSILILYYLYPQGESDKKTGLLPDTDSLSVEDSSSLVGNGGIDSSITFLNSRQSKDTAIFSEINEVSGDSLNSETQKITNAGVSGREQDIPSSSEAFPLIGFDSLFVFLQQKLVYPAHRIGDSIAGQVKVGFEIDTTGIVRHIKILNGIDRDFDMEALRVISLMPGWEPAKVNGKPVNSYFSLNLTFKLSKD